MNAIYFQLALVWNAAWVLWALRRVMADAARSLRGDTDASYLIGAVSIGAMWIATMCAAIQRVIFAWHGFEFHGLTSAFGFASMCLSVMSGWFSCYLGLRNPCGRSTSWVMYNIGLWALIVESVLS